MAELSPAAQDAWNAYNNALESQGPLDDAGRPLRAFLEAVTNRVVSDVTPPIEDYDEHSIGFASAHRKYRREFLAIAAELCPEVAHSRQEQTDA